MRNIFLIFVSLLGTLLSGLAIANAANEPVACTMQYAPVCGSIQVQCIRAPCNPVRQTFGNACMAGAAWATNITEGECGPIVGGDSDAHGCKASAGYSWDADFGKCVRPWETRSFVLTIAPNTVACVGMNPMECLRVRIAGARNWTNWYDSISGFMFEAGYSYRLRVKSSPVESLITDNFNREYALAKVIQKIPLMGTSWTIESLNGKATISPATLSFTRNTIQAKVCNSMFGSYTLSGNTIKAPNLASTMMYCEWGDLMAIENTMNLDNAKWGIRDGKLTLTTENNDVTVWKLR